MYRIGQEEIDAVAGAITQKSLFKINKTLQETMHAEQEMQALFGTAHPLLMTSGHAALVSGLVAMGIGPGDQVILPAYTYIATAMAVVAAGAKAVDGSVVVEEARPELSVKRCALLPRSTLVVRNEYVGYGCLELLGLRTKVVVACHIATVGQDADARRAEIFALRCGTMVDDNARQLGHLSRCRKGNHSQQYQAE